MAIFHQPKWKQNLWNDFSKDDDGHGGADDSNEAGGQRVQEDGQGVVDQDVALKIQIY